MAIPGLYIPIRGDYSDFQKDMARLAGIARMEGTRISEALQMAISPKDADSGLRKIGAALKQLTAAAQSTGRTLNALPADLDEFAKKANVATSVVEGLHYEMLRTARDRQLERSLREIQKQCGLTASAMAQLRTQMGDAGGSVSTAMEGLGIRPLRAIQAEIKEVEAQYQHMLEMFRSGHATENDVARAFSARGQRMEALQREAGTWQDPARVSPLRQRYDSLVAQAGRGGTTFGQFEARSKAKEAVEAFQQLQGRLPRHAKEFRELAAAAGVSAREIWKVRDAMDHTSSAFKALIGYGQVWLTFGFVHTAADFVKTAMALENVEVAFKAIYGTTDMAQKKLEYVRQVSDELGLSFLDTAEGAKKLFAAAQGTPIEAEANMVFKAFSNMSAAMKLTGDETKGVFLAVSQMISKGKVSAEELRQQLAERMPGAVNLFASSIGVSTQELDKMLQKGAVTLEHFLQFARAVNTRYAAGAAQASHTLQAELARIGNTWANFQKDMTDTGALADIAKNFNDVFKKVTEVIVRFREEIKDLMKAALAGWIASSLVPGGKLGSIIGSLVTSLGAAKLAMRGFGDATTTAAARMGMLGKAATALMKNPLIAALAVGATTFGLEKLFEATEDKNAFKDSGNELNERIAARVKAAAADKESRFTPEDTRRLLLEDTKAKFNTANLGLDSLGGRWSAEISQKRANLEATPFTTESYVAAETKKIDALSQAYDTAMSKLRGYQQAMQQGYDTKKPEEFLKVQDDIALSWSKIEEKLRAAGATDEMVGKFKDAFNEVEKTAGGSFDNISKYLSTFAADSTSATKTLGLEMDKATSKMFDKLEKASQSSPIGKAAKEVEDFQKAAQMLGDSPLANAFDSSVAACGKFSDQITGLIARVGNAEKVNEQYWMSLIQTSEGYKAGTVAEEEFSKARSEVDAQTKELTEWEDRLATAIFQTAAAAGGTDAQFNVMTQALKAAEQAGIITAEMLDRVLQKVNEVRGAAAAAMQEAADAAIYSAADIAFLGANASKNFKNNQKELWITNKQLSYDSQGKTMPTREALGYQYDREKSAAAIRESLKDPKKGRKGGGGGGKRVDNTVEKWKSAEEGWRKKIADMQGQKDVQTLAKDFADMDKQLKGSSVDMKALKKDYLEAFNTKYANDLNKELLQLKGNEAELARIDIEEKFKAKAAAIEGMAEEAKKLGITVQDYTPKLEEYRKLLEGQAREQQLQKELPYYEKFSWWDGNRIEAMEKQNELIAIQAEKMQGTIPDELIERWRELEELQNRVNNGNDVLAGITLGAKKYALEMGNFAQNVSDLVQKSFDDMADAFAEMVITGKANFTDLANSIIKDLMRIAIKQAIIGPIANGLGSLFGAFGFGGSMFGSAKSGIQGAISASSAVASVPAIGIASAYGNVFTGLHGFSNQIVNRPTLFSYGSQLTKFAKGGVMGEAGPEAVMPLTRTASGHLGVRSDGGNAPVVNVVINNSTGQAARQQTKTDNEGNKSIEVMIGDMAAQQMMKTGTALNKAARTFSGVSQQVTRR